MVRDIMKPTNTGQTVRFHTPYPDERPDQLYEILAINKTENSERADIRALNTGLQFPPINTVNLSDLIIKD